MPAPILPTYRAVIYARTISTYQAGSIEQQLEWAKSACKREGFHSMLKFCQWAHVARRAMTEQSDLYRQEAFTIQRGRDDLAAALDRKRIATTGGASPDAIVDAAEAILGDFKASVDRTASDPTRPHRANRHGLHARAARQADDFGVRPATIWLREDSSLSTCFVGAPRGSTANGRACARSS